MESVYGELVLEHYRNPQNKGKLKGANAKFKDSNPLCGDDIEIQLKVEKGRVIDARFDGESCALCTASASMLTEFVKGKSLERVKKISNKEVERMTGILPSPSRLKCLLLPLKVLKVASYGYLGKKS
jgi:nitrogen fixation NifU-like protein